MKSWLMAVICLSFSIHTVQLQASESQSPSPLVIQVESVVMGTDGQMRVRINGQYLTRQSEKDGIKVLDMDYDHVKVKAQGQILELKPHQTLKLR